MMKSEFSELGLSKFNACLEKLIFENNEYELIYETKQLSILI